MPRGAAGTCSTRPAACSSRSSPSSASPAPPSRRPTCATPAAAGSAPRRSHAWYYAAFNLFWAALLALPLADNLALAWLLIEATTAASALLVAFSGKRSALEAGWKYVVLTTLGLAVALLGIVVLFVAVGDDGPGLGRLDWQALARRGGRAAAAGRRSSPSS